MSPGELAEPLVLLSAIPWVVIFAWVARRLVGARRIGARHLLGAGLIGYAGGLALASLVTRGPADPAFAGTGTVFAVLFTMVAIVGLELLADRPPGPVVPARPALPHPVRALRRRLDVATRLAQVTRIAAHRGLGPALGMSRGEVEGSSDLAYRACRALEDAGGTFVKLGQLLSTRMDLLPPAAAAQFARLQEDVRPVDPAAVVAVLEEELGRPVDAVFAEVDPVPIGAASLAQVHRARMLAGNEVVVKVQRPGVADLVERDLVIVRRLARGAAAHTAWGAAYGVEAVAADFAGRLREELDFRGEARNAREVAAGVAHVPGVRVPRVDDELSTSRLLVMERLTGTSIGRLPADAMSATERRNLADTLLRAVLEPMVAGERFHGDPHPGNVVLLRDGGLGLLDFGATGRLDAFERASVAEMLGALREQDPTLLREALLEVAAPRPGSDLRQLDRALAAFLTRHLLGSTAPSARMFSDLLRVLSDFGVSLPASTTAMFRALVTLQGTLDALSPRYPIIEAAEKLGAALVVERVDPRALPDLVRDELLHVAPLLRRAPRHLDRLATLAERGELRGQVSLFADPRDARLVTRLVGRILLAGIGSAVGITSALLLIAGRGPLVNTTTTLAGILGHLGLFAAAALLARVVLAVLRDEDGAERT